MKKVLITSLLFALPGIASAASTFDVAFYTDGSFQAAVDSFKRVALFYGANMKWIIALFVGGVLLSALVSGVSATQQKISGGNVGNPFLGSLFLAVIGLIVFTASTVPKGTVHVYDTKKNKYEAVGGVPAVISISAGLISSIGQAFETTESTAKAYTYGELADGSPLTIIQQALKFGNTVDSNLMANISALYSDCASTAIASGSFDLEKLRSGTTDLLTDLDGLKHNSIETTIYSTANPGGIGGTCTAAIANIKSQFSSSTVFDKGLTKLCQEVGYNYSVAAEKIQCLTDIGKSADTIFNAGAGGITQTIFLQNIVISQAIINALNSGDYSGYMDMQLTRQQFAAGAGAMEAANRYIPILKGLMLSVIIGAAPVLLMFLVTPLVGKALLTFGGLLFFYGIWQLTDMVVLSAMQDQIFTTAKALAVQKMGLLSFMNADRAIIDTFSSIGTLRTVSISVAVFITGTLIRVSPQALTGFASKFTSDIESTGAELGKETLLPENTGQAMDGLTNGNTSMAVNASNSQAAMVRSGAMSQSTEVKTNNAVADHSGGVDIGSGMVAQDRAAQTIGSAQATQQEGMPQAIESAKIQKEGDFGNSAAIKTVANSQDISTRDFQEEGATLQQGQEAGKIKEMAAGPGILDNSINAGRADGARDKATASEVGMNGTEGIYTAQQQSLEKEVEGAKAVNELTGGHSREHFSDLATKETAENQGEVDASKKFSPTDIREAKAGDSVQSIGESLSKNAVTGGLEGREMLGANQGVISASDDIAEQNQRTALRDALGVSDSELSTMMVGGKSYNLNAEQAEKAHKAGIINDDQLALAQRQGAMVLDMNSNSADGKQLDVQSTKATFDESTNTDTSRKVDKSTSFDASDRHTEAVDHDYSMNGVNASGNANLFANKQNLETWLNTAESRMNGDQGNISIDVGTGSAAGIAELATFNTSDGYSGQSSVFANASVTAEAKAGLGSWFSISGQTTAGAEGRATDETSTSISKNDATNHFAGVYSDIRKHHEEEAQQGLIKPEEVTEKTAEDYAGYYSHIRDGLKDGNLDSFNRLLLNGSLDDEWKQYNQEHNLGVPMKGEESQGAVTLASGTIDRSGPAIGRVAENSREKEQSSENNQPNVSIGRVRDNQNQEHQPAAGPVNAQLTPGNDSQDHQPTQGAVNAQLTPGNDSQDHQPTQGAVNAQLTQSNDSQDHQPALDVVNIRASHGDGVGDQPPTRPDDQANHNPNSTLPPHQFSGAADSMPIASSVTNQSSSMPPGQRVSASGDLPPLPNGFKL